MDSLARTSEATSTFTTCAITDGSRPSKSTFTLSPVVAFYLCFVMSPINLRGLGQGETYLSNVAHAGPSGRAV